MSEIINVEKSKLSGEKAETTSQAFKVYKKNTIRTFSDVWVGFLLPTTMVSPKHLCILDSDHN